MDIKPKILDWYIFKKFILTFFIALYMFTKYGMKLT